MRPSVNDKRTELFKKGVKQCVAGSRKAPRKAVFQFNTREGSHSHRPSEKTMGGNLNIKTFGCIKHFSSFSSVNRHGQTTGGKHSHSDVCSSLFTIQFVRLHQIQEAHDVQECFCVSDLMIMFEESLMIIMITAFTVIYLATIIVARAGDKTDTIGQTFSEVTWCYTRISSVIQYCCLENENGELEREV